MTSITCSEPPEAGTRSEESTIALINNNSSTGVWPQSCYDASICIQTNSQNSLCCMHILKEPARQTFTRNVGRDR